MPVGQGVENKKSCFRGCNVDRRQILKSGLVLAGGLLSPVARAVMAPAVAAPPDSAASAASVQFPKGFLWGAGGASYQIEGAFQEDGRGPTIWDTFAHTPGRIKNGDTGDVACNSYHRYADDIALLKQLNLKSYRFSFAWSRIQPSGSGAVNQKGLDYYRRLVDGLLEAGIRPFPTLYHWDLPQPLEDAGGWPHRDTASRFADYVKLVADAFADTVKNWSIFNEPKTFTQVGYWNGTHAPGRTDPLEYLKATHVVNLAQGMAFRVLKQANPALQVGGAFDVAPMIPGTDSPADRAAAQRWERFLNLWFIQTALHGSYPEGVLPADRLNELLGFQPGDEKIMRAPLDFVGLNYYCGWRVFDAPQGNGIPGLNTRAQWAAGPHTKTDVGWDIYPEGFYTILKRIQTVTGALPLEITENGAAYDMAPGPDGHIQDAPRIAWTRSHLQQLARAIADGVPVRAYHHWALLDNFEWAEGFSQRFGIVYVDFQNGQARTIKESGHWYAEVAKTNRVA